MTPDSMVRAACSLIDARKKEGTRFFIAIDGGAGSGKSMLARGIEAQRESLNILRTDDFFRPLNEYPIASLAPEKLYELYFQWNRMRDEALVPLRRGKTATYQRYDWSTDRLLEWETIKPTEIVLVEGVYSSRPELRPMLDATIFVDAPKSKRLKRIKSRHPYEPAKWITAWMRAEDYYLTQIRPQDTADLTLPSSE